MNQILYVARSMKQYAVSSILASAVIAGSIAVQRVQAQLPVGAISGTVRDTSGAVIPGGTVTATSRQTGTTRIAEVSANGRFAIPALPAGEYDVRAEVAAQQPRRNPNWDDIELKTAGGDSWYHSLRFSLEKRPASSAGRSPVPALRSSRYL